MSAGRRASLWRNRDFRVLLTAQTLSALGDSFSHVAVPLLVLRATGSLVQMGVLTGLAGVSSLVTGVFAGYAADRVNRKALLVTCDLARCVLYGLIPLTWLLSPQPWLLYAVVPLAGAFATQFQVAYVTVVPGLVGDDRITEANGHLYTAYAVAEVGGPLLAGLVSAALGPQTALAVDAASFVLSAAGIMLIGMRRPAGPAADTGTPGAGRGTPAKDLFAGAAFLWGHPVLRSLTILLALLIFLTSGLTDLVIYHLEHDLRQSDRTVGYVLAAGTAGTLLAAAAVAPARRRLGFGACWIGAWALSGAAIASLGLATRAPLVAAVAAVQLFGAGIAGICSMSFRQEVTPGPLLGRVTSAFWTIHNALGPLGVAALTGAAAAYGVGAACLAAGAACVLIAAVALLTPVRRGRPDGPAPRTERRRNQHLRQNHTDNSIS